VLPPDFWSGVYQSAIPKSMVDEYLQINSLTEKFAHVSDNLTWLSERITCIQSDEQCKLWFVFFHDVYCSNQEYSAFGDYAGAYSPWVGSSICYKTPLSREDLTFFLKSNGNVTLNGNLLDSFYEKLGQLPITKSVLPEPQWLDETKRAELNAMITFEDRNEEGTTKKFSVVVAGGIRADPALNSKSFGTTEVGTTVDGSEELELADGTRRMRITSAQGSGWATRVADDGVVCLTDSSEKTIDAIPVWATVLVGNTTTYTPAVGNAPPTSSCTKIKLKVTVPMSGMTVGYTFESFATREDSDGNKFAKTLEGCENRTEAVVELMTLRFGFYEPDTAKSIMNLEAYASRLAQYGVTFKCLTKVQLRKTSDPNGKKAGKLEPGTMITPTSIAGDMPRLWIQCNDGWACMLNGDLQQLQWESDQADPENQ